MRIIIYRRSRVFGVGVFYLVKQASGSLDILLHEIAVAQFEVVFWKLLIGKVIDIYFIEPADGFGVASPSEFVFTQVEVGCSDFRIFRMIFCDYWIDGL